MTENLDSPWWHEWGVLCLVALIALPLFTPRIYASDEIKYFATLRSAYFDRDLHYENEYAHFIERDPVAHEGLRPFRDEVTPTGYRLNDAPIGTSLLWFPFYFVADVGVVTARALGATVPRDGYSWPYVWAVSAASLVWGTAGLFLTFRLCRRHAGRVASTWGVVAVWLASPVVFYLYITPAMSHASSLFAVALFLLVWHRGRRDRSVRGWGWLGVTAGLMVLVRELNWLFLLVVAVDEVAAVVARVASGDRDDPPGTSSAGRLVAAIWDQAPGYLSFGIVLALVVVPQFYVYQTLNGTPGPTPFVIEKFSLFPRHALSVLVSGFHGLFSWHPITFVGVLGLGLLGRRDPRMAAALLLVFAVQVLVVGSYDTWPGGASFGARRFINCTPIFALGVAMVVTTLAPPARRLVGVGILFLIVWNAGLAIQYSVGLIPRDAPVSMRQIVSNQVFEVPSRVTDIAWRFVFDRGSFYRTRT